MRTQFLNTISDLKAKQKAGTATQADVDHAQSVYDNLSARQGGKATELANGAKTAPGYFEQAAADAFDQSPVGRIANKIGGTKIGAGLIEEKQGEAGRRNTEFDQVSGLRSTLGKT